MSSLADLSGFRVEYDLVYSITKYYTHLTNNGKTIVLCWIPSHVNIQGNERADAMRLNRLSLYRSQIWNFHHLNFSRVWKFCQEEWQDCCEGNKFHSVYPTVCNVTHNKSTPRYDSVLINRLRIGHCRLTHSYLLSGDDRPTCTFVLFHLQL